MGLLRKEADLLHIAEEVSERGKTHSVSAEVSNTGKACSLGRFHNTMLKTSIIEIFC